MARKRQIATKAGRVYDVTQKTPQGNYLVELVDGNEYFVDDSHVVLDTDGVQFVDVQPTAESQFYEAWDEIYDTAHVKYRPNLKSLKCWAQLVKDRAGDNDITHKVILAVAKMIEDERIETMPF